MSPTRPTLTVLPLAPGQSKPSLAALRRSAAQSPAGLATLHDLGALSLVTDEIAAAILWVSRARAAHPADSGLRRLLALGLMRLADARHHGRWRGPRPWRRADGKGNDELFAARDLLFALAEEWPDDPGLHLSLGSAYQAIGNVKEASQAYRRALALAPAYLEALNNLGAIHADALDRLSSEAWLLRGLATSPEYAAGWNNLASIRLHDGRAGAAAKAAQQALDLHPGWAEPLWNLALAQLAIGDLVQGFAGYESRFGLAEAGIAPTIPRRWPGPTLPPGPNIVVRAEQGYGDMLQFVRYLPLLRDRGLAPALECHAALMPLLSSVRGIEGVLPIGGPFPEGDVQVALLSLPHLMGTAVGTIPAEVPYLAAPPERRERWRERLASLPRPRIGLNWQGNPAFRRDRERSPGFAPIRPLLDLHAFIGLVRDPAPDQNHPNLTHLGPAFTDFADTAACLEQLDLVITSDTALAHLAGALARPTWLLLHHAPDWRWLEHRSDSPWYPTLRLFRQPNPGDWSSVIRQVASNLSGFAP